MYKTWTFSASDADTLGRALEVHLNEYADEIVSVSYSVDGAHYALVVYKEIEGIAEAPDAVVAAAEQFLDEAHQ